MTEISIYKITDMSKLKSKLDDKGFEKKGNTKRIDVGDEYYLMEFYYHHNSDLDGVSWLNFALCFDFNPSQVQSNPRAVIVVENGNSHYAVSFGTAYHYVEYFSDRQWAFDFAKRVEYHRVNLMATTLPQSKLNKQISSYINYNGLDVNVGEALNKLTAYMELDEDFENVGDKIQAGTSLKLNLKKDNLETIAETISYVEKIIATENVHRQIPHMVDVKDETRLAHLNELLKNEIYSRCGKNQTEDLLDVNNYVIFSNEFINLDDFRSFELKYKNNDANKSYVKSTDVLTMEIILDFIRSNKIALDEILNIGVVMIIEALTVRKELSKILIYDCVRENCIYEYGKWTQFNQEYITMVENEVATIPAKYCPEYSFESEKYDQYLEKRIMSNDKENESFTDKQYNETVFNEYLHDCYDYKYLDKDLGRESGYGVELMDLYKDGIAYAVKKGNSASKLSYVVEQSIEGIKYLRRNDPDFAKEIKYVCIWFILERQGNIHDENNNADINRINALILKNRLVMWKRQMVLWGYEPIIRINYKRKAKDKKA